MLGYIPSFPTPKTPRLEGQAKDLVQNGRSLKCFPKDANQERVPKQNAWVTKENQKKKVCKTAPHIEWRGRRGGVGGIEFGEVGYPNSSCSSGGVYQELSAKARGEDSSATKRRLHAYE